MRSGPPPARSGASGAFRSVTGSGMGQPAAEPSWLASSVGCDPEWVDARHRREVDRRRLGGPPVDDRGPAHQPERRSSRRPRRASRRCSPPRRPCARGLNILRQSRSTAADARTRRASSRRPGVCAVEVCARGTSNAAAGRAASLDNPGRKSPGRRYNLWSEGHGFHADATSILRRGWPNRSGRTRARGRVVGEGGGDVSAGWRGGGLSDVAAVYRISGAGGHGWVTPWRPVGLTAGRRRSAPA